MRVLAMAVAVLWLATGYRVWIIYRKGYAPWRAHLAAGIGGLAIATTLYSIRARFDEWAGVPNLSALVNRVVITAAFLFIQLYVLDLQKPSHHRQALRVRVSGAALVTVVTTAAWVMAPIHAVELLDFTPVAANPAVVVYTVGYYAYLSWLLLDLAIFTQREAATMKHTDRPGAVATGLIAVGCYLGIVVTALWTLNVVAVVAGHPTSRFAQAGLLLFPAPMAVLAAGLLMLPLLPQITRRRDALRQLRNITPLWAHLVRARPDVRLALPGTLRLSMLHPEVSVQRRLIEIADALEAITVPADTAVTLPGLVEALDGPAGDARSAKGVLAIAAAPMHDTQAILALGQAFRDRSARPPRDVPSKA